MEPVNIINEHLQITNFILVRVFYNKSGVSRKKVASGNTKSVKTLFETRLI
jgi:hypothetical protein